ncbi:MAG: prepilin-type N-terminal cleavage/methylation domain-containing protein [Patescibacteria group bacterium]
MRIRGNENGFSLVEVVIATALAGIFVAASSGGLLYGMRMSKEAGRKSQAVYLAEEGLAAAQNIRDAAYVNLTNGTWGLSTTGSQWSLSGASDTTGVFTREVVIASADSTKKEVTSTVTWQEVTGNAQTLSLVTYFSDWLSATTSAWTTPALAGSIDLSGSQDLLKLATAGDYAYAVRSVSGSDNFFVFDISVPSTPTTVGTLTVFGTPSNVVISGDYAYVATSDNTREMQVISIASPTSPSIAASYDASGNTNATSVVISGSTAYLVREQSSNKEFLVLDVSSPLTPTLTGSLDLTDNANDVAVSGNYAYVASSSNSRELEVIDVTTPATPVLLGAYDISASSTNSNAVKVSGTTVYLGNSSRLYILSDATHGTPTLLGSISASGTVNDIALGNGGMYLFLGTANGSNEFRVLDATTPAAPTFLASVNLTNTASGVAYNETSDVIVVASTANSAEFVVINHP